MLPPEETDDRRKSGLVTFASFLVPGSAPLLSFIVLIPFTRSDTVKFVGATVLSALALVLLGMAKASITGWNFTVSATVTFFNGASAGAAVYNIGWTLNYIAGLQD